MDSTKLSNRVVSVVEKHSLVKFLCTIEADRGVNRVIAGDIEIADKFVEEQPPERLRTSAVPGEQRALYDLRKIDECEHRPIEVREVPTKNVSLVRCEGLWDVDGHGRRLYDGQSPTTGITSIVGRHMVPVREPIEITIIGVAVLTFAAASRRLDLSPLTIFAGALVNRLLFDD
jgi:hypothetical protein